MKCHGSFATYNIMGTVYNQSWKGMISILYNQRRLPMTKQCFRCNDIYQMVVDHGFVDPTFQSRDFRSGAPHFGELIIEYRACSIATLMLSRALPSLAYDLPEPNNAKQMCKLSQTCTSASSFGNRRYSQETFPARAPHFGELNIEQAQLGRFATQPAVGSWLTPVVLLDDHWDAMA